MKRFNTYNNETMQVVNYYREKRQLVEVDADNTVENIFSDLVSQFREFSIQ